VAWGAVRKKIHALLPVKGGGDRSHQFRELFPERVRSDRRRGQPHLFLDRRGDPQNRRQIVVLARSTDAGVSSRNYARTTDPFEAGGVFFGDYSGIAAWGGRVYGVWTEQPATSPEAEKMPMRGKQSSLVRWSKLASRISLQAQVEVPDKLHLSFIFTLAIIFASRARTGSPLESFVHRPCARFPGDFDPSIPGATPRREILDSRPAG
jgi:hypothetical protein